jgi:hypothetical protein
MAVPLGSIFNVNRLQLRPTFQPRIPGKLHPRKDRPHGTLLHICVNQTRVLADTGARIIELDSKVDLKVAKQMIGARVCMLGNLNPVTVLLQGSPLDVELAAEAAIAAAAEGGGYIRLRLRSAAWGAARESKGHGACGAQIALWNCLVDDSHRGWLDAAARVGEPLRSGEVLQTVAIRSGC